MLSARGASHLGRLPISSPNRPASRRFWLENRQMLNNYKMKEVLPVLQPGKTSFESAAACIRQALAFSMHLSVKTSLRRHYPDQVNKGLRRRFLPKLPLHTLSGLLPQRICLCPSFPVRQDRTVIFCSALLIVETTGGFVKKRLCHRGAFHIVSFHASRGMLFMKCPAYIHVRMFYACSLTISSAMSRSSCPVRPVSIPNSSYCSPSLRKLTPR